MLSISDTRVEIMGSRDSVFVKWRSAFIIWAAHAGTDQTNVAAAGWMLQESQNFDILFK